MLRESIFGENAGGKRCKFCYWLSRCIKILSLLRITNLIFSKCSEESFGYTRNHKRRDIPVTAFVWSNVLLLHCCYMHRTLRKSKILHKSQICKFWPLDNQPYLYKHRFPPACYKRKKLPPAGSPANGNKIFPVLKIDFGVVVAAL